MFVFLQQSVGYAERRDATFADMIDCLFFVVVDAAPPFSVSPACPPVTRGRREDGRHHASAVALAHNSTATGPRRRRTVSSLAHGPMRVAPLACNVRSARPGLCPRRRLRGSPLAADDSRGCAWPRPR